MKNKVSAAVAAWLLAGVPALADELKTTTWASYGVSFEAPKDITVEDDSEDGYIVSNDTYYITVQLLESEGMTAAALPEELKNIATDDEVTNQTEVTSFDLPQFHGAKLKGNCETDKCMYSYLLAKDGSCGFYISIIYRQAEDTEPEQILKSFKLDL